VYCPDGNVNNSQMAVFVIAMLGISPPACTAAPFADVPCTAFAASFIAEEARRQITPGCGGGNFCPNSLVTRAQMAGLLVHAFDIPVAFDPATPRSAQLTYTQGLLTGVTGTSGATTTTYGSLSYYPNLLVSQVAHGNGVTDTQGNDPYQMRRPSSLAASGLSASWSSGTYSYDGAGNIKAIGTSGFTYDAVSRLVSATLYDGPTGGGNQKQQSYTFDPFGNLTNIAGANGRATPTSAQTNRLNGAGTVYDAAGNLTSWNGASYQYDHFNQMIRMTSGSEDWAYLYTADDERIWSYNIGKNSSRWALRDLGSKVLREYLSDNGRWSVGTDYLYRDGLLLASETQTGPRHFHLDHLGTPRLITRASGDRVAYHLYYPFGEEATAFNQDSERMKFTGHERDLASPVGAGDDLDYMHARHESPVTGRFLSVDPDGDSIDQTAPQSFDRYAYVQNRAMSSLDPSGQSLFFMGTEAQFRKLEAIANAGLHGVKLVIDRTGKAVLQPTGESGTATPQQAALAAVLSGAINDQRTVGIQLVEGDRGVVLGQYASGKLDIKDVASVGDGPALSSQSALAHEVGEQTFKQFNQLGNTPSDFSRAHRYGNAAQDSVSGFHRGSTLNNLPQTGPLNGTLVTYHQQGSRTIIVVTFWRDGNLTGVLRQ
jgi:RHS repeat-associated protein